MGRYEKAIIKTLCYSSVFEYPLTKSQIWKFLIWDSKIKPKFSHFIQAVDRLIKIKKIFNSNEFYCLNKSVLQSRKRIKEEKIAKNKIKIAKKVSYLLSFLPTVELIGLSGKLSMKQAEIGDDVDLFVIVQENTLWITRFLMLTLLSFLGFKRNPNDKNFSNKICVNMIIETNNLSIPKDERDLFSAHEVVQMKMLYSKNNSYAKFITKNKWVKKYLPNTIGDGKKILTDKDIKGKSILSLVENLAQKFQLWYMKKKKTTEVITKGYVRFHPNDARTWVMTKYHESIKAIDQGINRTKDQMIN